MAALDQHFNGILPFVHTAEERSFRRAAARLGVTPAAVSKAVAKLEDELGARLLVRTSRQVARITWSTPLVASTGTSAPFRRSVTPL